MRERHLKESKNTLKTPDGECDHTGRPASDFCHGNTKSSGNGLCHRTAGWGTDHVGVGKCKLHFGNTKQSRVAGAEALLEKRARKELGQLNAEAEPIGNPLEELARLAGEAVRWKNIVAAHVAELRSLRYAVHSSVDCPACGNNFTPQVPVGDSEQIRGEVILYERALKEAASIVIAIGRLNIEDRLVSIEESKAAIVVKAVEAALIKAGVPQEKRDAARAVAGAEIRRLSAA